MKLIAMPLSDCFLILAKKKRLRISKYLFATPKRVVEEID